MLYVMTIKNPGIMGCSLMRPIHNTTVMILASSVHEIEPKAGFHKVPPMGQSVDRKSYNVSKGTMALYDHITTKR
jgi:hypothetical protein